jgi:hypothetical protein
MLLVACVQNAFAFALFLVLSPYDIRTFALAFSLFDVAHAVCVVCG